MADNKEDLVLEKFNKGENMFITGPGGSGKSVLIKKLHEIAILNGKKSQVCALSGTAAIILECKAKTLHSWAGIGISYSNIDETIKKIKKSPYKRKNWKCIDILIIDEISMMSDHLFELLDSIAKEIRNSAEPFGGIQVIFSGDFYQLPPVGNSNYCFISELWDKIFPKSNTIILDKIYRQTDVEFQNILIHIRNGDITEEHEKILKKRMKTICDKNIKPTKLLPTKLKVCAINNSELELLPGVEKEFKAKYNIPKYDKNALKIELSYMMNSIQYEKNLKLKIGAQVMCTINIKEDENLILSNGSIGKVINFADDMPVVKFVNGVIRIMNTHTWESENIKDLNISQIPLILAWALTIHKSQGCSLDYVEIDVGNNIFEFGQTYVALSRVKTLDGLYITSFNSKKIKKNKLVDEFYKKL